MVHRDHAGSHSANDQLVDLFQFLQRFSLLLGDQAIIPCPESDLMGHDRGNHGCHTEYAGLQQRLADAIAFDEPSHSFAPDSVFIAGTALEVADSFIAVGLDRPAPELAGEIDRLLATHTAASVQMFPMVREVLAQLIAGGRNVGLATNDAEEAAREQLELMEIEQQFSFVAGYDSGHGAKPGPGMVIAFAKQLDLPPAQVAMVGDSANDMNAALAAGALPIAVASGLAGPEDLRRYTPHVLAGVHELPEFLDRLSIDMPPEELTR